jgi:hypothetical protein
MPLLAETWPMLCVVRNTDETLSFGCVGKDCASNLLGTHSHDMVCASALLMSVGLFDVRNCRFRFLPLTTDVLAPVNEATMRKVGAILPGLFSF